MNFHSLYSTCTPKTSTTRMLLIATITGCVLACSTEPPDDGVRATQSSLSIVEYPLPRAGAFPHDPAVGADGSVWYTDQVNSYIGRLDPQTGAVTDVATPTPASGPHGLDVAPDGMVWYTAQYT